MNQAVPLPTVVLLALLALAVGAGAVAWYTRRAAAVLRERLLLAQAAAGQRDEQFAAQRAELEQARGRYASLEAERLQIERMCARFETEAAGLRQRLDEAQLSLAAREQALQASTGRAAALDKELAELRITHQEKLAALEDGRRALEQARQQLKIEFQNLANQILEEKGRSFAATSQQSLDALLKPFREQIQGFQQRVNQVHDESVRGNASLGAQIRQVLDIGVRMSTEANTLASALKGDKKTAGNWGEIQLENALQQAGLVEGEHYEAQPRFQDQQGQARQPDFVVKLPDHKHMVLDSKVSLVDYDRAIVAETEAERQAALEAHVKAVRNHIDDLSKKDYSNLIGMRSPSFVLMFMPIEPAYIEALKHNKDLFNYGYQKSVIMVSYTTLMPILKTVANLWMVARSNEQAQELSGRAGEIYNQVALVAERLKRLGATLGTASQHYNDTVTAVAGQQGLYGKVLRFGELSAKANKALPQVEPLHRDYEAERLDLVVGERPAITGDKKGS
ncbi:DNA recombination protein RmuC [Candidimonas nitroreducens]|uniref:DNA recombination protein RmuC n=1 Tax=Candidimonas nitroreducens TaxID=683354 RepID=A0A225MS63_9BURK|nr:DNA recombination protein RmuC [Candidimonas nitroreducens]OWT64114.1 DNA recombination protein RmuC [Candidimonas nitroreducens]